MCLKAIHTCKPSNEGCEPLILLEIQVFVHIFILKLGLGDPPFLCNFQQPSFEWVLEPVHVSVKNYGLSTYNNLTLQDMLITYFQPKIEYPKTLPVNKKIECCCQALASPVRRNIPQSFITKHHTHVFPMKV